MAGLAALFAALAIVHIVLCCVNGSGSSLIAGLLDFGCALVAFCIWAWSL